MKYIISFLFSFLFTVSHAKDIAVIIPFPPGGPTDTIWRSLVPSINEELKTEGVQLIVINKPGAGTFIATKQLLNSKETVLAFYSTALLTVPLLNENAKYLLTDFEFVSFGGFIENWVLSTSETEAELIEKCKKDNVILYGSSGIGSQGHLFGQEYARQLGCDKILHVVYKGQSEILVDLLAGRLDYTIGYKMLLPGVAKVHPLREVFFKNGYTNFHVLMASKKSDPKLLNLIKLAISKTKKMPTLLHNIQQRGVTNYQQEKDMEWLLSQQNLARQILEK
jgi:hypothetical protein